MNGETETNILHSFGWMVLLKELVLLPPLRKWQMISFFVTKNSTFPFHNLSAHCTLIVSHNTYSALFLKEEDPSRIICSIQPALTSSQSAYHMLRKNVIIHICAKFLREKQTMGTLFLTSLICKCCTPSRNQHQTRKTMTYHACLWSRDWAVQTRVTGILKQSSFR